ncbi:MAG: thioredoxin family protein [Bacilli bacterium]|nr:thioredoxin family protein [Bacilli bacterium]
MKKILLIGVSILTITLIAIILKWTGVFEKEITNESAVIFKEEYQLLNGKEATNGNTYTKVELDSDNRFVYADFEQIKEVIKGTGVIYFGFPECPWCRNAVPVIEEAAKEVGLEKIYYLNVADIRDQKELDENGNVVTINEGTEEYKELLELLHDSLPVYKGLNDPTIKRIYVPLVMTFKNGKVIDSHLSTVDSQENPYIDLTDEQAEELLQIYKDSFSQVSGFCPTEC